MQISAIISFPDVSGIRTVQIKYISKNSFCLIFLLLSAFTFCNNCSQKASQNLTALSFDDAQCAIDNSARKIFIPTKESADCDITNVIFEPVEASITINDTSVENNSGINLGTVSSGSSFAVSVTFSDGSNKEYSLIFTGLPLVQITTENRIVDEPKVLCKFIITDPEYAEHGLTSPSFITDCGIEIRGGTSQQYPKKSYSIEFWEDETGDDENKISLLGMREDGDWILDAMYIDKARMRNRVSTDLWLDMYEVFYQDDEEEASSATHGEFVEIFINNKYNGLYCFTEKIDRKQLKLKKFKDDETRGALYKAVSWGGDFRNGIYHYRPVLFENYRMYDQENLLWDGFEQKHPDPEDEAISWDSLYEFVAFVVDSDDSVFASGIADYIDISNAIDYLILLNVMKGGDNTGKNYYLARYNDDTPFMFVPWDMDGTWGRRYNSNLANANAWLSTNIFNRLKITDSENFNASLKSRWEDLRSDILSEPALCHRFAEYKTLLVESGAAEREKHRWPKCKLDFENELVIINDWIHDRLVYLDSYIENNF